MSVTVSNLKRIVKKGNKFVKNFILYKSSQKSISSTYSDLTSPYDEHEFCLTISLTEGLGRNRRK